MLNECWKSRLHVLHTLLLIYAIPQCCKFPLTCGKRVDFDIKTCVGVWGDYECAIFVVRYTHFHVAW